jgi:hypothetical protein
VKWQHGIAFSGDVIPSPLAGEEGMVNPVRVTRKDRRDNPLEKLSRINYGKMYTVEHKCKVYDFGDVHEDYIALLVANWKYVLDSETYYRRGTAATATTTTTTTTAATQEVADEDEGEEQTYGEQSSDED